MAEKIFIATVKIAVVANDENEAADAVSAILTENQRDVVGKENSSLWDWKYVEKGDEYEHPKEVCELPTEFVEGEVFDKEIKQ